MVHRQDCAAARPSRRLTAHALSRFLEPLDARAELGQAQSSRAEDNKAAEQAYATVQARVRQGLDSLLAEREADPLRPLQARVQQWLGNTIPSLQLIGEATSS